MLHGYTLFIKPNWIQSIFLKIITWKFTNKIHLKYTEGEKHAEAAAEGNKVVSHPKTWEANESEECSIMQALMFCTLH
jgi:hypothetical protein